MKWGVDIAEGGWVGGGRCRGKRQVLGAQEPLLKVGVSDKSSFKVATTLGRGG